MGATSRRGGAAVAAVLEAADRLDALAVRYTERQLFHEAARARIGDPSATRAAVLAHRSDRGRSRGLIDGAGAEVRPPQWPAGAEPDLARYGLTRVVAVGDPAIAHMLVENAVPIEQSCVVVTLGADLPADLLRALAAAPAPRVVVIVDCDRAALAGAVAWRHRLVAASGLSHLDVALVGLRPAQAWRLGLTRPPRAADPRSRLAGAVRALRTARVVGARPASARVSGPHRLGPDERAWLDAGGRVELAAVPPDRLIRAVARQFAPGAARSPAGPVEPRGSARHRGFLSPIEGGDRP